MLKILAVFFWLLALSTSQLNALDLDEKLKLVIGIYNLKPISCEIDQRLIDDRISPIGDIVFNTTVLSGNHDTSCSTCHIDEKHLTDGLSISIGVGAGENKSDRQKSTGVIVPRNSFTLFGRAGPNFDAFFWDGKVHEIDDLIYSPIGEGYSLGFKSPLAVAAALPILARDEFLGKIAFFNNNKSLSEINPSYYKEKFNAANKIIKEIVISEDKRYLPLQKAIKNAGVSVDDVDLAFIGNSLASFIAKKTSDCKLSDWEKYLEGDPASLSVGQKKGAIIFFGKGRCAACHSGNSFSDFEFHSIGTPQGEFGTHIHSQDLGRGEVTFKLEDRFKFRTPPLIGASKTMPYGHNGVFKNLESVISFHINPIPFFVKNGWTSEKEILTYGKLLSSRSSKLGFIEIKDRNELLSVVDFINSL